MHLSADSALPEACVDVTMYVCIINLQGHYIVLSKQYLSGFVWIKYEVCRHLKAESRLPYTRYAAM